MNIASSDISFKLDSRRCLNNIDNNSIINLRKAYHLKHNSKLRKSKEFHIKTKTNFNYNEPHLNNDNNYIYNKNDSITHLRSRSKINEQKKVSFSFTDSSYLGPLPNQTKQQNTNANLFPFNTLSSNSNSYSMRDLQANNSLSKSNNENKESNFPCSEREMITSIIQSEREIYDNEYETNEYFLKLKLEEFNTAFFTLISIICGMIYHNFKHYPSKLSIYNKHLYEISKTFTLILVTINVILFNLSSLNRYLILLHINKSSSQVLKTKSFFSFDYFGCFIIESVFSLFHPNHFTKDVLFTTNKHLYIEKVTYELNDILLEIMFLRVYILFRYFISYTKFYSARSYRIASLIGSRINRLFVIRCIVLMYPFTFLVVCAIILVLSTGYMLRIAEAPAYKKAMGDNDYRKFVNCLWNVLVTMTTVGYGDYYPITFLGRLINIFVSLWGNCLTSFMVVALQNWLVFNENEAKAFESREKQLLQENFQKAVAKYFISSFRYIFAKKRYRKSVELELAIERQKELKKEMEKALYNKINDKRKFKKLFHFYRNRYEVLTEEEIIKEKMDKFQEQLIIMDKNTDIMEEYIRKTNKVLNEIEGVFSSIMTGIKRTRTINMEKSQKEKNYETD